MSNVDNKVSVSGMPSFLSPEEQNNLDWVGTKSGMEQGLEGSMLDPLSLIGGKSSLIAAEKLGHNAVLKTPSYMFDPDTYKGVFAKRKPKFSRVDDDGAFTKFFDSEIGIGRSGNKYIDTMMFGHENKHYGDFIGLRPKGTNPQEQMTTLLTHARRQDVMDDISLNRISSKANDMYMSNAGEYAATNAGYDRMARKLQKDFDSGNISRSDLFDGLDQIKSVRANNIKGSKNSFTEKGIRNKRTMLNMFPSDKLNKNYGLSDEAKAIIGTGSAYGLNKLMDNGYE